MEKYTVISEDVDVGVRSSRILCVAGWCRAVLDFSELCEFTFTTHELPLHGKLTVLRKFNKG